MAFFSLTGYAEELDVTKFTSTNIPYGSTALAALKIAENYDADHGVTYTVDYTHFYTEATGTGGVEKTVSTDLKTAAPNLYYIKISGTGTYSGSVIYKDFRIYPTMVQIDFDADQKKTFGDPEPANYTYALSVYNNTTSKYDPVTDATKKAALVEALGLTVYRDKVGTTEGENAGLYDFKFNWIDKNYQLSQIAVDEQFEIEAKAASALTVSLTLAATAPTYTGAEQTPVFTVKDGETTLPNDQFDLVYTYSTTKTGTYTAVTKAINAGFYKVTATAKTGGNYTGTTSAPATEIFEIAQAPLDVYINPIEVVYDGNEPSLATAVIGYSGLKGTDATSTDPFGAGAFTAKYKGTGTHKAVGTYTLELYENTTVTSASDAYKNYAVSKREGSLEITKKAITVKPTAGQNKVFGADDPTFTVDASAAATTTDAKYVAAAYEVTRPRKGTDEAVGKYPGTLIIAEKAKLPEGYEDAITAKLANYTITLENGDFEITAGSLTVYPMATVVEYGTTLTAESFKVVAMSAAGKAVTLNKTPKVIVEGFDEGTYPKAVKTYVLKLKGEIEATGYTADDITTLDGQLTINKKTLTPMIGAQTLNPKDLESKLDQTKVTFKGLVGSDEISYKLAFNITETGAEGLIPKTSTTGEGTTLAIAEGVNDAFTKGIKIVEVLGEGDKQLKSNANYTIDWTATGNLIVGSTFALTFDDSDAGVADKIALYAGEKATVKIKFGKRNAHRGYGETATETYPWKAEKWTTMVLPFDITVRELSNVFGYAIVNVINPEKTKVSGTGSEFWGKVTMKGGNGKDDVLAANKPFMLKLDGDLDATEEYDFGTKTIVAPSDLTVVAGEGVKFAGTYAAKKVTKADNAAIWFMNGNEDGWQFIGASSPSSWTIAPFEAYIDMSSVPAGARSITFNFEDIDGTVTAIKSINAENLNKNMSREGWYNLNGVKLQGAPTQKGIYIQNGQKVVVK